MVGYDRYESPTDVSGGVAKLLVQTVNDNETFIMGIDCADGRILKRYNTRLFLTDRRVLALRDSVLSSSVDTYELGNISRVGFDSSAMTGDLTLSGSGFDEDWDVPATLGGEFASAIREQIG